MDYTPDTLGTAVTVLEKNTKLTINVLMEIKKKNNVQLSKIDKEEKVCKISPLTVQDISPTIGRTQRRAKN